MSLKPCAKCGRMVSTKAPRCPKCGLKRPALGRKLEQDSPLLFSPDALRVPTRQCPECHREVSDGIKRCPYCGLAEPGNRPLRKRLLLAVGLASIIAVAAWAGTRWLSGDSEVESGLVSPAPLASTPLARVRAFGFGARCTDPAPVYVVEAGAVPDTFIVVLEHRAGDPDSVAKGLAKKYRFTAGTYERAESGFTARLSPSVVARIRCDPSVKWLEEQQAKRYSAGSTP